MAKRPDRDTLLNPLKLKLQRKTLPAGEALVGAGVLGCLVGAAAWALAQGENYDPAERDISFEVLQESSVADTLYRRPVKRWLEPGSPSASTGGVDLDIFPPALLDGGWTLDGRIQTFDPTNLFEKINGAAEQYLSFGFRALHYLTLAKGPLLITLELYDLTSFQNALGLFAAQRDEEQALIQQGPITYYPTSVGAIGVFQPYYFKITGHQEAPELIEKARTMLELLMTLPVDADAIPAGYRLLTEGLGLPFQQVAYQKADVFQYDFFSDVWFGQLTPGGEARCFFHQARDEATARQIYAKLLEEQGHEYGTILKTEDSAILEHTFLKTLFVVTRRGAMLYGVEGASDRASATAAVQHLEEALDLGQEN